MIGLFHSCEIGLARNLLNALANPQRQKLAGPRLRWYLAAQIPLELSALAIAVGVFVDDGLFCSIACVCPCAASRASSHEALTLCRLASVTQCFRGKSTRWRVFSERASPTLAWLGFPVEIIHDPSASLSPFPWLPLPPSHV